MFCSPFRYAYYHREDQERMYRKDRGFKHALDVFHPNDKSPTYREAREFSLRMCCHHS
jgi:hypothetical protein